MLDIGTGSGILAVAAARAGARHVYAVEATDIAAVAERVFAANGVQDRVTLIAGWSRQIELPEPADLLMSEIIGSEPFEEEILETTLDARRRLLKPGARLIPNTFTLLARPLLHSGGPRRESTRWARRRRALATLVRHRVPAAAGRRSPGARAHDGRGRGGHEMAAFGPPVVLAAVDLTAFHEVSLRASADLVVDTDGWSTRSP